MAAGRAAECGAKTLLLEKTARLGNKLRLTGKGRCNLTSDTDLKNFIHHFGANGRFLYGALSRFTPHDLVTFFERRGVPTVTERGGRVFPASNDAHQVADVLAQYVRANDAQVRYKSRVDRLLIEGERICGVMVRRECIRAKAVVIATGGASYPATGSTGDGYRLAESVGHHIIPIRPALVPLVTDGDIASRLQGLNLRHVRTILLLDGTPLASEFGEMLFTHFGVSGPIILTLSKRTSEALSQGSVELSIDLKPALNDEELDARLRRGLERNGKRQYHNFLRDLLPGKMVDIFVELTRIPADKPGNQVTAEERERLRRLLKDFRLKIVNTRPIAEAIVTAGGVDTREIDPRTMASRLVKGLFFCGEVIDIDADTGGYNLQAAFSTGYVAGEAAAHYASQQNE